MNKHSSKELYKKIIEETNTKKYDINGIKFTENEVEKTIVYSE